MPLSVFYQGFFSTVWLAWLIICPGGGRIQRRTPRYPPCGYIENVVGVIGALPSF